MVNFVLNTTTPTEEQFLAADINQDGILNILDVIGVVSEILGTNFAQSVKWLEKEFPELKVKERLEALDKSEFFAKKARKRGKQNRGRRIGGNGLR